MDELLIDSRDESSLIEEASVVATTSALGLGSAALFFRNGHGRDLNNYIVKAKYMMRDFPQIETNLLNYFKKGGTNPLKELEKIKKAYQSINVDKQSLSFNAIDQDSFKAFEMFYKNKTSPEILYQKLYAREIEQAARVTLDRQTKKKKISADIYEAISAEIKRFSKNPDEELRFIEAVSSHIKNSKDVRSFDEANEIIEEIFNNVRKYMANNPYNEWEESNYARKLFKSSQQALFSPSAWLERQEEKKKGFFNRLVDGLNPDRHLTIGDILDIGLGSDEEKKKTLRNLFENSEVMLGSDSAILARFGTPIAGNKGEKGSRAKTTVNFLDIVYNYGDQFEENELFAFKQLEINGIRVDSNGNFYADDDTKKFVSKYFKGLNKKFPFNMFHINEMLENMEAGDSFGMTISSNDPNLNYLLEEFGLSRHEKIQYSAGRMYVVDKKGRLHEIEDLRGKFSKISTKIGIAKKVANTYYGVYDPYPLEIDDGSLLTEAKNYLGIEIERIKRTREHGNNAKLYGHFNKNNIKLLKDALTIISNPDKASKDELQAALGITKGIDRYKDFLFSNTKRIKIKSAEKIFEKIKDSTNESDVRASQFLEKIINLKTDDDIVKIINELANDDGVGKTPFLNTDLIKTVIQYKNDPSKALKSYVTKQDVARKSSTGKYSSVDFRGQLIEQLEKEFYLEYSQKHGFAETLKLLNNTLEGADLNNAKNMAATAQYNSIVQVLPKTGTSEDFLVTKMRYVIDGMSKIQNDKGINGKALRQQLRYMENIFGFEEEEFGISLENQVRAVKNRSIIVRKPIKFDSRNFLTPLNEGHLDKAFDNLIEQGYNIFRQFFAGANDPNHFTTASFPGGSLLVRLNDSLNSLDKLEFTGFSLSGTFGIKLRLGLKPSDATSGWEIGKNLMLKRALPAYGLYTAWEMLNDFSREATGASVSETFSSGMANVDLGIRKFMDITGAGEGLDSFLKDNALADYIMGTWGQEAGFDSYEEKKKYYERGYDAVRKARFWTFGSSNEFRGGRISYWQPNSLRQASSNWENESLYNGSLITKYNIPYHILNPYWLEDLHSEDRPYPYSATMFDENTPWGIALNATVGELWKPRIKMHQDRLSGGVDVKALIAHVNSQIRERSDQNLLYVQRGRLSSFKFNAFNAPTYSERIWSINGMGDIYASNFEEYQTPVDAASNDIYQRVAMANAGIVKDPRLTIGDKIAIAASQGNPLARLVNVANNSSLNIIKSMNEEVRAKASYDRSQGLMQEEKLAYQVDPIEHMLSDSDTIAELMQEKSHADYIKQMAVSARMLTGLYGWMGNQAFGIGGNKEPRIATANDMTSTSRAFWDSGYGGLGGDVMEIVRRVIPEYRRFQTKNPLMNTMPDWLPERLRFGDPYTAVPKGEMRMPGRGYESLNELHPDVFGTYGAFDRFKILADVAPYSPEYKFWKKVAEKTVSDPQLKEEMGEIKERVREQSKQHDFYNYKYVGRSVERNNVYITEVLENGQFKVFGTDEIFKLAGVRVKSNEQETQQEVLSRYIRPGQLVELVTDENVHYGRNRDKAGSINAGIVIGDKSVGDQMLREGDAVERRSDFSVAGIHASHNDITNLINWGVEALMHADIPILHNRWMRANDPLEDYKDEYIYGSSFQSWDDVIDTFIIPNMRKAASSEFWTGAGILSDIARNNIIQISEGDTSNNLLSELGEKYIKAFAPYKSGASKGLDSKVRTWANRINLFSDRGALMGNLTGGIIEFGNSDLATFKEGFARRAGSIGTLAFSAMAAEDNLPVQLMTWSRLGYLLANENLGKQYRGISTLAGLAIGAARWASSVQLLSDDETADVYIPDSVRKRWDMNDYFDRLTYIKYMSLFEKASQDALEFENVDIKSIMTAQQKEAEYIYETKQEIKDILRSYDGDTSLEAEEMKTALRQRLRETVPTKIPLNAGEYTKSAVMYYNAARATMYALDETSTMTDVVRALPKVERDYYMAFLQERDPEKRKEIMSYASPQLRKALKMAWYQEFEDPESNESYFASHNLPGPLWSGWDPNTDLADVQAKIIKNEGMMSSDFGVYASQYSDPNVINAPYVDYKDGGDGFIVSAMKIQSLLNGYGLIGVDVSVEPSQDSRLDVIANVGRIVAYDIENGISNLFS